MVQHGVGAWMEGIFPTAKGMRVFGRAVTAQFSIVAPPRQIVDQFDLIDLCSPGDVLVWNVPSRANICGENIMHYLANHKLGGLVIDGYTRDGSVIEEMGIPQFTRGLAIAPAPRNCRATPDDVNVPVSCGGTVVCTGDYVFGDDDGMLVVPAKDVDTILMQAAMNMRYEKRMEDALNHNADIQALHKVFETKTLYEPKK
jgi:4-hydroxy-4-methyl-2-oxoglutarate aldolase